MKNYVVLDLEMCKVQLPEKREEFGAATELIQIGAVMLDEEYNEIDTFMRFVRPEYGSLDPFIENLTGIHKENLQDASSAAEVLAEFTDWITDETVLVSWSLTDLDQFYYEIDGKGIDLPKLEELMEDWIDCQYDFSEKMETDRSYNLTEALNITALDYSDGAHDALVDAKNTALLFKKIQTEDKLTLSPYLLY